MFLSLNLLSELLCSGASPKQTLFGHNMPRLVSLDDYRMDVAVSHGFHGVNPVVSP